MKVQKIDLFSLKKILPSLSEKEKNHVKGGSYYYDQLGNFLGQKGDDSTLRIVNAGDWSNMSGNGAGDTFTGSNNLVAQEKILTDLLPSGCATYAQSGAPSNYAKLGFASDGEGGYYTVFMWDAYSTALNNYYNMKSVMAHEYYHCTAGHVDDAETHFALSKEERAQQEIDAIMAEIASPYYANTSGIYKADTSIYLYDCWRDAGLINDTDHTIADAKRICGSPI